MNKFEQIYKKYYLRLVYFAQKYTNNDKDDAEDIVCDVFVNNLNKIIESNSVQAFLFITTRNACYNYLRSIIRHNKDHKQILYLSSEIEERDFGADVAEANLINMIYEEIERLPERSRLIIKSYIKGDSTKQIAKNFNISPQTVLNLKNISMIRLSEIAKLLNN